VSAVSRVGWVCLAVGWAAMTAAGVWLVGPAGLFGGGFVALIVGVLVVDWEEVARGEPAGAARTRR
jgi:hypothetical protein